MSVSVSAGCWYVIWCWLWSPWEREKERKGDETWHLVGLWTEQLELLLGSNASFEEKLKYFNSVGRQREISERWENKQKDCYWSQLRAVSSYSFGQRWDVLMGTGSREEKKVAGERLPDCTAQRVHAFDHSVKSSLVFVSDRLGAFRCVQLGGADTWVSAQWLAGSHSGYRLCIDSNIWKLFLQKQERKGKEKVSSLGFKSTGQQFSLAAVL